MFEPSLPKLLILLVIVLVLFGRGKMSEFMGDFAKGIKSFKKGMADDEPRPAAMAPPAQVTHAPQPVPPVQPVVEEPRA